MAENLPETTDSAFGPGVTAAIDGVARSHAGHPLDEIIAVLREAIGQVDPKAPDTIPPHRLRDIAQSISDDHHRPWRP
ncbi:hypothetical protein ACFFGH_26245 [Lysobacter korlensis]|uniref:Uncharacterized protein n=1 Tax=Lysobacter korlensis TaxID=553636 RepID=A0ABV6RWI8_9GAMM